MCIPNVGYAAHSWEVSTFQWIVMGNHAHSKHSNSFYDSKHSLQSCIQHDAESPL